MELVKFVINSYSCQTIRNNSLFLPFHQNTFVMKRLLLLVLVLINLFAVAQENFTLESYKDMPLKMHRADLYFGEVYKAPESHLLPDEELKSLLGTDLFNQYETGRTMYYVGNTLKTTGWITFGVGMGYIGFILFAYDYDFEPLSIPKGALPHVQFGALNAVIGIESFIAGYIIRGIGKGKINDLLEQYNRDKHKVTLNISPTLMRCQLPQGQNPMALGITFSVGF